LEIWEAEKEEFMKEII